MVEWKNIEGYEGYYISNDGRVVSDGGLKFNPKELKHHTATNGYIYVKLTKNKKKFNRDIHRLLGIHFISNPDNLPEIDHIDRDRKNFSLSNLRWISKSANKVNRKKQINNSLGYKNISYRRGYYRVSIKRNYKVICDKTFKTLDEAIAFRDTILINS